MIKLEGGGVHLTILFCVFVQFKKIARKEFEAEIFLNLFLILGEVEAQCSYKIVLMKEKSVYKPAVEDKLI